MKYYLHDTSAFDDEKVTELFINFGYEGVGLFYVVLEKLAKQEKPVKTEVLKKQLRVGKKLGKCWFFMEQIGIISSNNGETFNKQLLNFSEKYQIKKEKTRKKVSEWREKQDIAETVTSYKDECNPPKVKESKVKESKVNNIELIFPSNDFKLIWKKWTDFKKSQFNEKYKDAKSEQIGINGLIVKSGSNENVANEIVENSIANLYKGLFQLKTKPNQNGNEPKQDRIQQAIQLQSDVEQMIMEQKRQNDLKNG